MKIVTIVGARPQFIKAAGMSRELRKSHREFIIHTGQHYDYMMAGVFFEGLDIPLPDINLGVGSASHGAQTGAMLGGIENVLKAEQPDWVLTYGDTNSTLAGALAAAKLHIPTAHIEAGLRSYNRRMPEEINRIVADHLSDLLACPSTTAVYNLAREGITRNVHMVGDVMLDVLNWTLQRVESRPAEIMARLDIEPKKYLLATIHRSENTDDFQRFASILDALNALDEPVIFPVHPRSRKVISHLNPEIHCHVRLLDPLGYFDMVALSRSARLVLTDSGGLQKEAYWLAVPCITLRDETEWVETVEAGWNMLVGSDSEKIVQAVHTFSPPSVRVPLYGDGKMASRFVGLL